MYDEAFFDMIRPGVQSSAEVVVPWITNILDPVTVIDVGCGEGWWAAEFCRHGSSVVGVDGHEPYPTMPIDHYVQHDLREPIPAHFGPVDLAVSLEVAEHLPPERAAAFVSELCHLAPVVVFSAAAPGQGGVGHVNEQPLTYWASIFADLGYVTDGGLRWQIWDDDRVEPWYRQNLVIAAQAAPYDLHHQKIEPLHPLVDDASEDARMVRVRGGNVLGVNRSPFEVRHPVIFDHVRGAR